MKSGNEICLTVLQKLKPLKEDFKLHETSNKSSWQQSDNLWENYCKYCISVVTNGKYSETNSLNKLQLSRHSFTLNKETDNTARTLQIEIFQHSFRSSSLTGIVKLAVITFLQLAVVGFYCLILLRRATRDAENSPMSFKPIKLMSVSRGSCTLLQNK